MIVLDYRDKRPIYEQVVDKLERLIASGALETDSKMPSVRSLAMELSVNPNTIQRAYALLEQSGYLYTISGRGNFVAPESEWRGEKERELLQEFGQMVTKMKEAGINFRELDVLLRKVYGEEEV